MPDGGHVFTANPDGTHEHQLLADPADCSNWSPDGTKIAVCVIPTPQGLLRSATLNPDGTGFNLLDNPDPSLNFFCWAWSPDGSRLACEGGSDPAFRPRRHLHHAIVRRRRPRPPHQQSSVSRRFDYPWGYSPDGTRILFTASSRAAVRPDNGHLFVVNTDGTGLHAVESVRAFGWPAAPRTGLRTDAGGVRRLLQVLDRTGSQSAAFVVNVDGSGLHQLTPDGLGAKHPKWSPDGRLIAFNNELQVFSKGSTQVYVVHPDGSGLTRVTRPHEQGHLASSRCGHPTARSCCSRGRTSRTAWGSPTCGSP